MAPDDTGDDDLGAAGPPLPPDDRLWRHPSEVGFERLRLATANLTPTPRRPALWAVAVVAGLAGATLSTGLIAATRSLDRDVVERPVVVEKVALTPAVSTPIIRDSPGVAAVTERLRPAIVHLEAMHADGAKTGSGVIYRDDGLLLTSSHVVHEATTVYAVLHDGDRVRGRTVGLDPLTGIALVDLDGDGFPVAVLGSVHDVRVGAAAVAIGSPARSDESPAVTTGVISALDRRVTGPESKHLHGMIQIDAPTDPTSSGGALLDEQGAVIGILAAVSDSAGKRFGYATPIDLAHRIADQLLTDGKVTHCWLGVEGHDLSAEEADLMSLVSGAVVERVAEGSPAADAGIARDDVITEIDGVAIRSISHLVLELRTRTPGDEVVVGYWRDGQRGQTRVTLEARP